MNPVLITARTRINDLEICLGGIDLRTGQCVRLSTNQSRNFGNDAPFQIDSVWEMQYVPRSNPLPPHVEDVSVQHFEAQIRSKYATIGALIDSGKFPHWRGTTSAIFAGTLELDVLQESPIAGGLVVFENRPLPTTSLGYWVPDRDLPVKVRRRAGNRMGHDVYYVVPGSAVKIVHSGFGLLPDPIPAGSLLSLSLARWWKPKDKPHLPLRCTLQICDLLSRPPYPREGPT